MAAWDLKGTVLTQQGHGAYPSWARCLPLMGRIAVLCLSDIFMHTIFMFSDFSQRIKKYEFSFSK